MPLFRYLTNLKSPPPLDLDFALLVILHTHRHHRSAVKVYVAQGKRAAAVELALQVDPALAREICQGPEKRDLWLMIARDTARGKEVDVSAVVAVLRESR